MAHAKNQYDVIVIGSGLGGLSSAARLSRAGLKVRLLERHLQPGGYATTFYRDPYEFEVSLHELSGIGTHDSPGPLWKKLHKLGITDKVDFLPLPHLYRSVAPEHGLDLRIPASRDGALEVLVDAFPRERPGLTRFFERIFAIQREIGAIRRRDNQPSVLQALTRYPAVSHAATVPLSALLYRELKDPLARLAVGQIWSYFGLPPSRLSLVLFAGGLTSYLTHGACYIKGKSQALSNAFTQVIEQNGGEVALGNGAARILSRDGRVTGIVTDGGEQLETNTVVANANPVTVALDLIGGENLPGAFLKRLALTEPSTSAVCVHLGMSRDRHELGLQDQEVFINGTVDLEQQYADTRTTVPPDSLLLTAYNVADAEFSPSGTAVVVLVALADGRIWQQVDPQDYPELKQRYAEQLVRRAGRLYPELPKSIEVVVVSTPITNMRYTGNIAGAIYGFANTPAENPAFRLQQPGPLEGLWFAGAWTRPGGGFEPVISSGIAAAEAILAARGMTAPGGQQAA